MFEAFEKSTNESLSLECARYGYIPKLGIAIAGEGKNRVALFRELGMNIPAMVREEDYPDADQVCLYRLDEGDYAVLDGRFVERITCYALTSIILEPYGVITKRAWPDDYPSITRIEKSWKEQSHRISGDGYTLDMKPLLHE